MAIVIVDDSVTNMIVLKRLSASVSGADVLGFTSAREALAHLERTSATAVVVDYEMPDLDGISFIRILRQSERHRTTPLLMVTGNGESDVRAAAVAAGASGFLTKPVSIQQFKSLLREHMLLDTSAYAG